MYTSYIGQKFIGLYNRKMDTDLNAEAFFDTVMFKLFFDNEKHLMHVSNSPFFQSPTKEAIVKSGLTKSRLQGQNLKIKIADVASGKVKTPDSSYFVGFAANGPDQTTSGQVTGLDVSISADEIYASWIGNAFASRVSGGCCLLIDNEDVLWHIYQGWTQYRKYLDDTPKFEGRQIETWNGQWLAKGGENMADVATKLGKIDTADWMKVLHQLTKLSPVASMYANVFSFGQMNKTIGFINLKLRDVTKLGEVSELGIFKGRFSGIENSDDEAFWDAYETEFSFQRACQFGEVGLRALQPKDFTKLMDKPVIINDKNKTLLYNIQIWIIAMLDNKQELQDLAEKLASFLRIANEIKSDKAKERRTGKANEIADTVFAARNKSELIESLTGLMNKTDRAESLSEEDRGVYKVLVKTVLVDLTVEQFPLFKSLVKFSYYFNV